MLIHRSGKSATPAGILASWGLALVGALVVLIIMHVLFPLEGFGFPGGTGATILRVIAFGWMMFCVWNGYRPSGTTTGSAIKSSAVMVVLLLEVLLLLAMLEVVVWIVRATIGI